jgi:hypothetical protein
MMEAIRSSETSVLTRAILTSKKTAFFIVTAVKTSNLTRDLRFPTDRNTVEPILRGVAAMQWVHHHLPIGYDLCY